MALPKVGGGKDKKRGENERNSVSLSPALYGKSQRWSSRSFAFNMGSHCTEPKPQFSKVCKDWIALTQDTTLHLSFKLAWHSLPRTSLPVPLSSRPVRTGLTAQQVAVTKKNTKPQQTSTQTNKNNNNQTNKENLQNNYFKSTGFNMTFSFPGQ